MDAMITRTVLYGYTLKAWKIGDRTEKVLRPVRKPSHHEQIS